MAANMAIDCARTSIQDPSRANSRPQEKNRQKHFINLIPSENFTSQAVLDALGSVMQSTADNGPATHSLPQD